MGILYSVIILIFRGQLSGALRLKSKTFFSYLLTARKLQTLTYKLFVISKNE